MRKFIFAITALTVLAVSCGKEKIATKKEIERKDPTSISLSEPRITLYEGEQQTLTLSKSPDYSKLPVVTVNDPKKETPMLVLSSNDNVAYARGLTIQANEPGTATITASLVNDPSVKATCEVTVLEYINAVSLSSISLSKSSIQLSDLGSDGEGESMDITVTLTPDDSREKPGWEDVVITCNDQDVKFTKGTMNNGTGTITVSVESNRTHHTTNVHTANLIVKAKKGLANSKTLGVDVRGHVYGISVPKLSGSTSDPMVYKSGNEYRILLVKGKTFDLDTQIDKTGTLKDGAATGSISYSSSNSSVLSVSSAGVLNVSGTPLGGSSRITVTINCSTPGVSSITVPVYTYYEPTGYTLKLGTTAVNGTSVLTAGESNYTLSITATPDKALCDIKINASSYTSEGTDDLTKVTVVNNQLSSSQITFGTSAYGSKSPSDYIQIGSWINNKTVNWTFKVDSHKETELKLGDYVYYTPSVTNGTWYHYSDGGLRAAGPNYSWVRRESKAPQTDYIQYLIGICYTTSTESSIDGVKLRGLRSLDGDKGWYYDPDDGKLGHAYIISARDPKFTDGSQSSWVWGSEESYIDIEANSHWDKSQYGSPKGPSAYGTYKINKGIGAWNSSWPDSDPGKRIKAIYSVDNYNSVSSSYGGCPLKLPSGSNGGATGWLLPVVQDMNLFSAEVIKEVNASLQLARNINSNKADLLSGPYWLANYDSNSDWDGRQYIWPRAYKFCPSQNTKIQTEKKSTSLGTRPIAIM